jgi:hypothetical protein
MMQPEVEDPKLRPAWIFGIIVLTALPLGVACFAIAMMLLLR